MYKYFFQLFAFCLLLSACSRNLNLQERGTDFLQGVWEEDSVAYQNQLLQYTHHTFKFTCDSFYATLDTYSKVNAYTDSCFNNGHYTEYAKGLYVVKKDSILISGTFTKANFKQKISGCYRNGQYLTAFVLKKQPSDTLYLKNMQEHLPMVLVLKQKINCVPKPID